MSPDSACRFSKDCLAAQSWPVYAGNRALAYPGCMARTASPEPDAGDDHLSKGRDFLRQVGRSLHHVQLASFGRNESGDPQALVLGWSAVEILDANGRQLLEVGDRDIRGLRLIDGRGVEVCISKVWTFEVPTTRWMHCVRDEEAQYLEQAWLNWVPLAHEGTQLTPLPWREEEYAYRAGRVVTEAARCDAALTGLVVAAKQILGEPASKIYGASGGILADALDRLGWHSATIADIGERYRAWYKQRNYVVHGVRGMGTSDHPLSRVFKPAKASRSQPEQSAWDVQDQDFSDLTMIWHAFWALRHDAILVLPHLATADDPEEVFSRIPQADTVLPSERLPPGQSAGSC